MSATGPKLDPSRAFQRIWQHHQITPESLEVLVDAVQCDSDSLAPHYLAKLTSRHPEACNAVESLAMHSDPAVKLRTLRCLYEATPLSTVLPILRRLVTDPSPAVRDAAAWRAAELHRPELTDALSAQLRIERVPDVIAMLKRALSLLRRGYAVEPADDGWSKVYVLCRKGVISTNLPNAELERMGLEEVVRQWRRW